MARKKKKRKFNTNSFLLGIFLGFFVMTLTSIINNVIIQPNIIPSRENGKTVEFKAEVMEELNEEYINFKVERMFCLAGTSDENKITITKVDEFITKKEGTETSLELIGECPNIEDEELIGLLHFHSNKLFFTNKCKIIGSDLFVWGLLSGTNQIEPNNLEIFAVQCGKDKFMIIDTNTNKYEESLRWTTFE